MATMISNGGALDSNNLGITQFLTATSYSNAATQIVASFGGGRSQILLGSFVFDGAGALIGGTITSIVETVPGGSSYQISGLSFPVTSFLGFLNPPNDPGLGAALFAGNDGFLGNSGSDTLNGSIGADSLSGLDGDDVLDGGTGVDQLVGGKGNDTYFVDSFSDQVIESGNQGNDTVISTVSNGIAPSVENLTLVGTATLAQGNELANVITGNAQANAILGMEGNDTLLGADGDDGVAGGIDNDSLAGGIGNDTLDGESGNDSLDGGAGADKLRGGEGDDTYIVDILGDTVTELSGKGTDTVISSASYSLANNVENLTLIGDAKTGEGNELDNIIIGNNLDNFLPAYEGNDTLVGAGGKDSLDGRQGNDSLLGGDGNDTLDGGTGNDRMEGGEGNDVYGVTELGDQTIEFANGGIDSVNATINHQLASNIENLTLFGGALTGAGNDLNNFLFGNNLGNQLYGGAGNDTLTGIDGNDTLDGGANVDVMDGGKGDEVYLVDDEFDQAFETAGGGGIDIVHSTTASFTLGTGIENLALHGKAHLGRGNGGANVIIGNEFGNELHGLDGNDTLNGGVGSDTMHGGQGDDLYLVDDESDDVFEDAVLDGGSDTAHSTAASFTLGSGVENLVLKGNAGFGGGNELDNAIDGSELDNALDGADGNDSISGGSGNDEILGKDGDDVLDGGAGADTMDGGLGNDLYLVDAENDSTAENEDGGGIDNVHSTFVFFTLGAGIENLTLKDIAWFGSGNELDNLIIGNDSENSLDGGDGNDTLLSGDGYDFLNGSAGNDLLDGGDKDDYLDGGADNDNLLGGAGSDALVGAAGADSLRGGDGVDNLFGDAGDDILDGGSGADNLTGGTGSDLYLIDDAGDWVNEFGGEGVDTIRSIVSYSLAALHEVENLTLLGTANTNASGNVASNILAGNGGNNFFEGFGGIDTMIGGAGDDTYFVIGGEVIVENAGEGLDIVLAQASYQLAANIENLTAYTGHYGIEGKGNELNNIMTSNEVGTSLYGLDGADTIIGGISGDTLDGGAGADIMTGGGGDDVYGVDSKLDVVTELSGGGTDTVQSSIDYTLARNFENLVLIDAAYRGVGNNLANVITGNDAVNDLNGGSDNDTIHGGDGNDSLHGGFGNDQLYGGAGNDRINCYYNQDRVIYSSVLDGHDLLTSFSTSGASQDYVDLDALFDSLAVAAADRTGRVSIVDNGGGADVCVDTDGVGGWDLNLASILYVPDLSAISVGTDSTSDVFVGT